MATTTITGLARPAFIVDHQSEDRDNGHQIDWANVGESFKSSKGGDIVVGAAGAAANATSIPIAALTFAIPNGTALYFGGTKKLAVLTAAAAIGATTLTVEALPTALVENDTATYVGSGLKTIPAGQSMHIQTTGAIGKMIPYVDAGTPVASGLLLTTANEGQTVDALTGYGLLVGGVVYENLLPEATGTPKALPAAIKTSLAANSKGFLFRQYADTRAT